MSDSGFAFGDSGGWGSWPKQEPLEEKSVESSTDTTVLPSSGYEDEHRRVAASLSFARVIEWTDGSRIASTKSGRPTTTVPVADSEVDTMKLTLCARLGRTVFDSQCLEPAPSAFDVANVMANEMQRYSDRLTVCVQKLVSEQTKDGTLASESSRSSDKAKSKRQLTRHLAQRILLAERAQCVWEFASLVWLSANSSAVDFSLALAEWMRDYRTNAQLFESRSAVRGSGKAESSGCGTRIMCKETSAPIAAAIKFAMCADFENTFDLVRTHSGANERTLRFLKDCLSQFPFLQSDESGSAETDDHYYYNRRDEWQKIIASNVRVATAHCRELLPLFEVLCGNRDTILTHSEDWCDYVCACLLYSGECARITPLTDVTPAATGAVMHRNAADAISQVNAQWTDLILSPHMHTLCQSLRPESMAKLKRKTDARMRKSTDDALDDDEIVPNLEWILRAVVGFDIDAVLQPCDDVLPPWFSPHLCYCFRLATVRSSGSAAGRSLATGNLLTPLFPRFAEMQEIKEKVQALTARSKKLTAVSGLSDVSNDELMRCYRQLNPGLALEEYIFEEYVDSLLSSSTAIAPLEMHNYEAFRFVPCYLESFEIRGADLLVDCFIKAIEHSPRWKRPEKNGSGDKWMKSESAKFGGGGGVDVAVDSEDKENQQQSWKPTVGDFDFAAMGYADALAGDKPLATDSDDDANEDRLEATTLANETRRAADILQLAHDSFTHIGREDLCKYVHYNVCTVMARKCLLDTTPLAVQRKVSDDFLKTRRRRASGGRRKADWSSAVYWCCKGRNTDVLAEVCSQICSRVFEEVHTQNAEALDVLYEDLCGVCKQYAVFSDVFTKCGGSALLCLYLKQMFECSLDLERLTATTLEREAHLRLALDPNIAADLSSAAPVSSGVLAAASGVTPVRGTAFIPKTPFSRKSREELTKELTDSALKARQSQLRGSAYKSQKRRLRSGRKAADADSGEEKAAGVALPELTGTSARRADWQSFRGDTQWREAREQTVLCLMEFAHCLHSVLEALSAALCTAHLVALFRVSVPVFEHRLAGCSVLTEWATLFADHWYALKRDSDAEPSAALRQEMKGVCSQLRLRCLKASVSGVNHPLNALMKHGTLEIDRLTAVRLLPPKKDTVKLRAFQSGIDWAKP